MKKIPVKKLLVAAILTSWSVQPLQAAVSVNNWVELFNNISSSEINITSPIVTNGTPISGVINTVINGNGNSISGDNESLLFDFSSGSDVTFSNVIVQNSQNISNGGAIYTQGVLTINDSEFSNNKLAEATADGGGALFIKSGKGNASTISNSKFYNNSSLSSVDGYETDAGAITLYTGDLTINNSDFVGNKTSTGGAVYVRNQKDNVSLTVNGGTFRENIATWAGGAMAVMSKAVLDGVKFVGNKVLPADKDGGGALFLGAVSNTEIKNAEFSGNLSASRGGAISTRSGADADNSAAILKIDNTTFSENKAATTGGAIDNHFYNIANKITNSTFFKNSANKGGAIANHSLADKKGNTPVLTIENSRFEQNTSEARGGAIYNEGTMTVGGDFVNNHAGSYGGAIYSAGDLTITGGSTFVGNTTDYVGGAIAVAVNNNAELNIGENVLFQDNSALYDGGAIGNYYTSVIADGAKFINNQAQTGSSDSQAIGGGAISLGAESKTSIVNSEFTGNTSGYDGGAIGSRHSLSASNMTSKLSIKNTLFSGNKAMGTVTSTQGTNTSNMVDIAGGNGGAIANHLYKGFNGEDGVQVVSSTFKNNVAAANGGAIYNGGYADAEGNKANIVISNSLFEKNSAALGGAIYNAAQMTLDSTLGTIDFVGNTDANGLNDLYLADASNTDIVGSNAVNFGGGIAGHSGAILNNTGNVVLASGSINENFLGVYNQTAGKTTVNSTFFGGVSNITGGQLLLADGSKVVSGSTLNLTGADVEATGNVVLEGLLSATSGTFNVNNATLSITGDQSDYAGTFTQVGENSVTEISNGKFFAGGNTINDGKLVVKSDALLSSNINMDSDTVLDLDGRTVVITSISGQNQIELNDGYSIIGSAILENTNVDASSGISGSVTIADDSTLQGTTTASGTTNVDINSGASLTLGAGSDISDIDSFDVANGGSLTLSPEGDMSLDAQITGDGEVAIAGDDVGNIAINSDNSGFTGDYNQSTGNVTLGDDAVFFGGENTINGDGSLVIQEGALLASDIDVIGDTTTPVSDLASIEFSNSIGGVTQAEITSGLFEHESTLGTSNVSVQNATVILNNNTLITELDSATNSLVLQTNTTSNEGVRLLGLANGSGVDGDITLKNGTGVAYGDGAYIKDDSAISMDNADLIFYNDNTDVTYNPEISGSGSITKIGSATTSISSALNDAIDVEVGAGTLNLLSEETTGLGDLNISSNSDSASSLTVAAKELSVGDINVIGENSSAHFAGELTGANAVVNKGTLGLYSDSALTSLSLGSTLTTLDNVNINTVNVNSFTLNEDSSFFFDANPKTGVTDRIVTGLFTNGADSVTGENAKLIISGIAFTESPIDRNVTFDLSNVLTANSGDSTDGVVQFGSNNLVVNSAMGRYLISSSGSANALNASLISLNPQMHRGQVATVASWQNQLVVNNMLFDHTQAITRQLMDDARTANLKAAAYPQFAPYQYSAKDGSLWYKAYGNFETLSMTRGLNVGNNAYGSLIGADFPQVNLKNGWKLIPTAYVSYNGAHQHFNGVSMYQNGAQLGVMGTAYKGDFLTSLLAYGGGYANDMTVRGEFGNGSDNTGNWFAGVASKTAYNIRLPKDFIFQPTMLLAYNAFGSQNWGSNFGGMSMSTGMLNGINAAPGFNLIWSKKTFSLYATAQMVYNIMGSVDGKAGNVQLDDVKMRHSYFEYGVGVMKRFKDTFSGYFQITLRNGGRTGVGFQGGLQWKVGKP